MKRSWLKRPHRVAVVALGPISGGRDPPRTPHGDAPPGYCRWCGRVMLTKLKKPDRRRTCHKGECRTNFNCVSSPGGARFELWKRDDGVCAMCGVRCDLYGSTRNGDWNVDHIYPLWLVDRTQPEAYRYWMPGNLQTLCLEHHKEKSRRDARDRAHIKRLLRKHPGQPVQLPLPGWG